VADLSGLLVDFGGVLTTPVTHSWRALRNEVGLPSEAGKDVILEAYRGDSREGPMQLLETGRMTGAYCAELIAASLTQRTGITVEPQGLVERMFAGVTLHDEMLDAVVTFRRAGVRTGLLSNSWGDHGYPTERFGDMFDTLVISGEVGLRKPDPEIFQLLSERFGLDTPSTLFVDDSLPNVEAARRLGFRAHHFRSPAALEAELVAAGLLPPGT